MPTLSQCIASWQARCSTTLGGLQAIPHSIASVVSMLTKAVAIIGLTRWSFLFLDNSGDNNPSLLLLPSSSSSLVDDVRLNERGLEAAWSDDDDDAKAGIRSVMERHMTGLETGSTHAELLQGNDDDVATKSKSEAIFIIVVVVVITQKCGKEREETMVGNGKKNLGNFETLVRLDRLTEQKNMGFGFAERVTRENIRRHIQRSTCHAS